MGTGGNNEPLYLESYEFYPQMKAESQSVHKEEANTIVNGTCAGFHNGVIIGMGGTAK